MGCRLLALSLGLLVGCGSGDASAPPVATLPTPQYGPREAVTVTGYTGDLMEPHVTRDGQVLFFNNSNAPGVNTDLHWATRVSDLTFAYQGPLTGANTTSLDAVASVDASGQLYFTSTRSYFSDFRSIYRGAYAAGAVTGVTQVLGSFTREQAGYLVMDVEVVASGERMYLSDARFTGGHIPVESDLVLATRSGTSFDRTPTSAALFAQINTSALEYAPALTPDELTLFFTRLDLSTSTTAIYVAVRRSVSAAFEAPVLLTSATGPVAEAVTVVGGGERLYYHAQTGSGYRLYHLRRLP